MNTDREPESRGGVFTACFARGVLSFLLLLAPRTAAADNGFERIEVDRSPPQNPSVNGSLSLDRWQRHVIDDAKPWRSLFIAGADIDCDGHQDIVTGGWWYRNPGGTGPLSGGWERRDLGDPLRNMAVVHDFDADGDVDVLGTGGKGSDANPVFVWARNNGSGSFQILKNIEEAEGDFLQGVAAGRFFGDRRIGVALSWHKAGNGVQMLTVPVDPSAGRWGWQRISDQSQDEQISAGHLDGGDYLDLFLGTKWLRNTGDGWSIHPVVDVEGDPDRNRLTDMNGDGRLDGVVGFQAINVPGKLAWYEQPESPFKPWVEHLIGEVVGPMSVDVGDLDRDGDPDVVVGEHNYKHPETAKLFVFENTDGLATKWEPHLVHEGDEHHDGAVLIDIDGDGDQDIISIGWKEPEVILYENQAVR